MVGTSLRSTECRCEVFKPYFSVRKFRNDCNTLKVFSLNLKDVKFPKAMGEAQEVEEKVWPSLL